MASYRTEQTLLALEMASDVLLSNPDTVADETMQEWLNFIVCAWNDVLDAERRQSLRDYEKAKAMSDAIPF